MEKKKSCDLELMLDNNRMSEELRDINGYLQSMDDTDRKKTNFMKVYSLKHESIIHTMQYDEKYIIPPVFSECALRILENFYREDIANIDLIMSSLHKYSYLPNKFYIYFYWIFLNRRGKPDNDEILNMLNENTVLKQKIYESIDIDVRQILEGKPAEYFSGFQNEQWLIPFLYYFDILFAKKLPPWMNREHILKLTVVPDPGKMISTDISINWFEEKFGSMVSQNEIINFTLSNIKHINNKFSRIQLVKYFIDYYKANLHTELSERIMDFIIDATIRLFNTTSVEHNCAEFQYIGHFWLEHQLNDIDALFPVFSVNIILSAMKKNEKDIDYQYRRDVLQYCSKAANDEQKKRIINEIEKDILNKKLTNEQFDEVNEFLASLGHEKSIRNIMNSYIKGKDIKSRYNFSRYSFGFIYQSDVLLNDFISLFFYSTEKSNERRNLLLHAAQDGIKRHLTKTNFALFEKKTMKRVKNIMSQNSWLPEFYEEYLLQMEQAVF